MFEKEAKKWVKENTRIEHSASFGEIAVEPSAEKGFQKGAEFGYNKANEWHYVKDGDLPKQYEHTCFSIEVLANNKKWVYYQFTNGKWFCGNKEVKVIAWKEIVLPKESE